MNIFKAKSVFYMPKNTSNKIMDDLNSFFSGSIEFKKAEFNIIYDVNKESFFCKADIAQKAIEVGNVEIEFGSDSVPALVKREKNNEKPLSLLLSPRETLFTIEEPSLRHYAIKILDYLSEKHKISADFCYFYRDISNMYFEDGFLSTAINPKIVIKDTNTNQTVKEVVFSGRLGDFFLKDGDLKYLSKAIDLQQELRIKTNLLNRLFRNDFEQVLKEQYEFFRSIEIPKEKYTHSFFYEIKTASIADKKGIDAVLKENAAKISYFSSIFSMENQNLKQYLFEDNIVSALDSRYKAMFELYNLYPDSSPTLSSYMQYFRNYDKAMVASEMAKKTELGIFIENIMDSQQNNEIMIPQGVNFKEESFNNFLVNPYVIKQKLSIFAPTTEDIKLAKLNDVELITSQIKLADHHKLYGEYSACAKDNRAKIYLDISKESISDSDAKKLLEDISFGYVVTKMDFETKYSSIKIDDGKKLIFVRNLSFGEDEPANKPFENLNTLMASCKESFLREFISGATISSKKDFEYIVENSSRKDSVISFLSKKSTKPVPTILEIAAETKPISSIPTSHTVTIVNQNKAGNLERGNTSEEAELNRLRLREIYQKAGYNIEEPEKNPPIISSAFSSDGSEKSIGYPLKIDLKTQKSKEIFLDVLLSATKNYAEKAKLSDSDRILVETQIKNVIAHEETYSAAIHTPSVVDRVEGSSLKIFPFEFFEALNKDGELVSHFNIPAAYVYEDMLNKNLIDMSPNRLQTPPLTTEKGFEIVQKNIASYSNFLDYITQNKPYNPQEIERKILHPLYSASKIAKLELPDALRFFLSPKCKEEALSRLAVSLMNISSEYVNHQLGYIKIPELEKAVFNSNFKKMSVPTQSDIRTVIQRIITAKNNKELQELYKDLQNVAPSDYYEKIEDKILNFAKGKEAISKATHNVALSMLYNYKTKTVSIDEIQKIESGIKLLEEKAKEVLLTNPANKNSFLDVELKNIELDDTNNWLEQSVNSLISSRQDATINDLKSIAESSKKEAIKNGFSTVQEKMFKANGLRKHQVLAILSATAEPAKIINVNFVPRGGKTPTTFGLFLALTEAGKPQGEGTFYVQNKNYLDIANQAIRHFPEHLFEMNFADMPKKSNIINDSLQKKYIDREVVFNIPRVLKKFLSLQKSSKNKKPEYVLNNSFASDILSIQDYVNKNNKGNIEKLFNDNIDKNPFYALYKDFKKHEQSTRGLGIGTDNSFQWKPIATMTMYISSIAQENYLNSADYDKIKSVLLDKYDSVLEELRKSSNPYLRLTIESKNNMNNTLPSKDVISEYSQKNQDNIKKIDNIKIDTYGKSIQTTPSFVSIGSKATKEAQEELAEIIEASNARINFIKDSSLEKAAKEGNIILMPDWKNKQGLSVQNYLSKEFGRIEYLLKTAYEKEIHSFLSSGGILYEEQHLLNLYTSFNKNVANIARNIKDEIQSTSGLSERNHKDFICEINDILIDGNSSKGYMLAVGDILQKYIASTPSIVKNTLDIYSHQVENSAKLLSFANRSEMESALIERLNNITSSFALNFNKNTFIKSYSKLFYPQISAKTSAYQKMRTSDFVENVKFGAKPMNIKELELRYIQKGRTLLLPSKINNRTNEGAKFCFVDLVGEELSPIEGSKFIATPLNESEISVMLKKNSQGIFITSVHIKDTDKPIKYNLGENANLIDLGSTFIASVKKQDKHQISAVDEIHKNINPTTSLGAGLKKIEDCTKTLISITGTPVNTLPNITSIREIKNETIGCFFYLASVVPEFNQIFKNQVLSRLDIKRNKKEKESSGVDFFGICAKEIPNFINHTVEYFLAHQPNLNIDIDTGSIKKEDEEEIKSLLGNFDGIANKLINGIVENVKDNHSVGGAIKESDLPAIDLASIEFYRDALGDEAEKVLQARKLMDNAQVTSANIIDKKTREDAAMTLKMSSNITYDVKIDRPTSGINNNITASFLMAAKYFSLNKINAVEQLVDRWADLFLDSFLYRENLSEKEIRAVNENRRILKNALTSIGFTKSVTEILNSENSDSASSLVEITKDMIKNNGASTLITGYKDEKIIKKLEAKIEIAKSLIIPNLLEYINGTYGGWEDIRNLPTDPNDLCYIDKNTNFNILFPKDSVPPRHIAELRIRQDKSGYISLTNTAAKDIELYFSLQATFGEREMQSFFPNVSSAIIGDFEPYKERVLAANTKNSYYAFHCLTNESFNNDLKDGIKNGYHFPIFTERVGSNLFASLAALEFMMQHQQKQGNLESKSIVVLCNNNKIANILNQIDKTFLRLNYNIDFRTIMDTNDLQTEINKLLQMGVSPNVLVAALEPSAEGFSFFGFDPQARILYPDGSTIQNNFLTTIQSVSRVDNMPYRDKVAKELGIKNIPLPVAIYNQLINIGIIKETAKETKKLLSSDSMHNALNKIFEDGKIDKVRMDGCLDLLKSTGAFVDIKPNPASDRIPFLFGAVEKSFTHSPFTSNIEAEVSKIAVFKLLDSRYCKTNSAPEVKIEEKIEETTKRKV